ncbi:MAG: hypothetical protein Q9222_002664 [Ikaeria aurantiellina]
MPTYQSLPSFTTTARVILLSHARRHYCWARRRGWSYDTYPKSLKHLDSSTRSGISDSNQTSYTGGLRKDAGILNYTPLQYKGWRSSSSWGKWNLRWNDKPNQNSKGVREDADEWTQSLEKLEKDTAELYELLKKRIDADPFDALFGRRFLYPNRPTWWNINGQGQGKQQNSATKSYRAKEEEGVEKQHNDQTSARSGEPAPHRNVHTSSSGPLADSASVHEELYIDPISMRRVPRKAAKEAPEQTETPAQGPTSSESFNIAVKRFESDKAPESSRDSIQQKHALDAQASAKVPPTRPYWLVQEGFARPKPDTSLSASNKDESITKPASEESSARDTRAKVTSSAAVVGSSTSRATQVKLNEDLDLLRASDVRASSQLNSIRRRDLESQKQSQRQKLEARFEALRYRDPGSWGMPLLASLKEQRKQKQDLAAKEREEARDALHQKEVQKQKAAMEAMETRKADPPKTDESSKVSHPEQAEGDMAANVHEFATRDRWYKRKAPHAVGLNEQRGAEQEKATSLIKEIRGIYENAYGTIDTRHRQPGISEIPLQEQKVDISNDATVPSNDARAPKSSAALQVNNVPLSMQEKIGTLLQQLLDDSHSLQRLLKTVEPSSAMHKELYYRNRSIRNASDAITEALSSNPPLLNKDPIKQEIRIDPTVETAEIKASENSEAAPCTEGRKQGAVYSVLAYDPSVQQVTTAEMSSTESPSERKVSLSEALSSLTEPARFLPHLTKLQSQGYEIISSDTNILVLKKMPKAQHSSQRLLLNQHKAEIVQEAQRPKINPVDGTTTQTGNFASPTGFVNHDSVLPSSTFRSEEAEPSPSRYKVRRKEDVFSGPSGNRWEGSSYNNASDGLKRRSRYRRASRRKRTTKRMLWVGLWTAGCCYAVGAITEFLRA